ncbi:PD-(D/E)XK motif protein [Streptomyces sp. NPDC088358]|uniref:PD-(D/E)XK motif protein n=1 Tax=Streptomyces sp. NPDC088358 TaxID=3365857 RepID=UPI003810A11A
MTDETLRRLVEECWTALRAEQTTDERRLRATQLPVTTESGPLAVAVDHEGNRHLLVPIHAHRKIRTDLEGSVLRLRKRALEGEETYQTYADLACLHDEFGDLFTELCVDVLTATEGLPGNPVKALYRVLDHWKALFQILTPPLAPEQLAGLFGELLVLNRLLERDPSAHRFWRGPEGYHHDFSAGISAVEVKSTTASDGRRPRIHGLNQLEAPDGGTLCLVWFRLRRAAASGVGTPFVGTIERALGLCDDEVSLLGLLARAGYRPSDADRYHDVSFMVAEEKWYRVDVNFPGLTARALNAAGVTVSALDVEYTIDLSGAFPAPLPKGRVEQMIDIMIQESV